MALLRLQDNVPEVYVNDSRDFQLISRVYDCVNNGVKFDIESLKYLSDTKHCRSSYLGLLKCRQGFSESKDVDSDTLRTILEGFPYIIKNKGNKTGIKEVLNVFSKVLHVHLSLSVQIINYPDYIVKVKVSGNPSSAPLVHNLYILEDLMKYVLPAGYQLEFVFETTSTVSSNILYNEEIVLKKYIGDENSRVIANEEISDRVTGAVDTTTVFKSKEVTDNE